VDAGSVQEDDDQLGLAHLLEHMAFNGSTNFEGNSLIDYMESVGMSFGAHVNAHTSFEETVYKLQVPTDDLELLDKGLLVLDDWAGGVLN
ncbi:insulinase family protein, partial [Vibrio parahaemolyticus]|uniref:insulinase family protein n=1 Tax=Vibrio parahaemolyticus TaxID=670 RepID=UPI0021129E14